MPSGSVEAYRGRLRRQATATLPQDFAQNAAHGAPRPDSPSPAITNASCGSPLRASNTPRTHDNKIMDTLTPAERSERMRRIRCRDTRPEWTVRRLTHGLGYRYRLHGKDLPGKPDLVFPRQRKAVFVHGCFWHQHPNPACKLARLPKSRLDFWETKLQANRDRDMRNEEKLRAAGWKILVVWECETGNNADLMNKIKTFLDE